jgi:hypothetical protein
MPNVKGSIHIRVGPINLRVSELLKEYLKIPSHFKNSLESCYIFF